MAITLVSCGDDEEAAPLCPDTTQCQAADAAATPCDTSCPEATCPVTPDEETVEPPLDVAEVLTDEIVEVHVDEVIEPETAAFPCGEGGLWDGHDCYDCSEEGWCTIIGCPSDGNPCTLEKRDADGDCSSVPNEACREPLTALRELFLGAQAYYQAFHVSGESYTVPVLSSGALAPLAIGPTPAEGTCCLALGGPTPAPGSPAHDDLSWASTCTYDATDCTIQSPWTPLSFIVPNPHRYVYSFTETGDGTVASPLFEIRASGDLDCDGLPGVFVLEGSFSPKASAYNYLNPLAAPTTIRYLPEEGEPMELDALWAADVFANGAAGSEGAAYYIPYERTLQAQHAEALQNLRAIVKGVARWFAVDQLTGCLSCMTSEADTPLLAAHDGDLVNLGLGCSAFALQGATPIEGTCCSALGGPDSDEDGYCDPDEDVWNTATWTDLGFVIDTKHRYTYSFTPSVGDGSFSFSAGAADDPWCCGVPRNVSITGEVVSDGSECVLEPAFFFEVDVEGYKAAIAPWFVSFYDPVYATTLFELQSEERFEVIFGQLVSIFDDLTSAIDAYVSDTCLVPATAWYTPLEGTCCSGLGGPDVDGDGFCDPNPTEWLAPPWSDLGFAVTEPTQFVLALYHYNLGGGLVEIQIEAYADKDCDGIQSTISRIGIADTTACTVTWLDGYAMEKLFE